MPVDFGKLGSASSRPSSPLAGSRMGQAEALAAAMTTSESPGRSITPFDVSDPALYVEDRWHEPFAELRRTMRI